MMLTSETPIEDTGRSAWTYGWVVSALVHLLLAGAIFMGLAPERMVERRESFQWTVQLIGRTPSDSSTLPPSPRRTESNPSTRPDRRALDGRKAVRPIERGVAHRRPVFEAPSVVERVNPPHMTMQPVVSEPVQREVRDPVQMPVRQKVPGAVSQEVALVALSGASEQTSLPVIRRVDRSPDETSDKDPLAAGLAEPADPAISLQAESAGVADDHAGSGADTEWIASGDSSLKVSVSADEASARVSSEQTQPQSSANGAQRGTSSSSGSQGASTQPEYGWVARAIRVRIEEVKRYSPEAKRNEWEGQVVLTASVQADGQIVDIQVRTSSGNAGLDENARAIVAEASPLHLPQPLGVARIRLRIPLQFGLE
ncbi:MAG: TonBC domain-containing protein [Nitrospira sp.]|nr:MAG: TonBC domain-containing protein [Nitrospira sp.]